jgi:tetratricopeptide (TPR) repeat protein
MVRLDPVNNHSYYSLGLMHRYLGEYDEAIAAMETALSLSPERVAGWSLIAESLVLKGEPAAAIDAISREKSIWHDITLPLAYYAAGRTAESDEALNKLIRDVSEEAAYNIAYNYAYRGEADLAFEWLEKAIEFDDPGLSDIPVETLFANIHDDPRWLPLLERLGKAPGQLDAIEFEVNLPE